MPLLNPKSKHAIQRRAILNKTWVLGDPHFGHENVMKFAHRPFHCIEEHDEHVISKINYYVHRNDRLIIAGDVCWKDPQKYRQRINCKEVILVFGNHDKKTWGPIFSRGVDNLDLKYVDPLTEEEFNIFVSHYPHAYWPGSHRNDLHVYGHVHDAREETLDRAFPGRRSMDVGIDTAKRVLGEYRPFSLGEVVNILRDRKGHDSLDHYRQHDEQRSSYQLDSENQVVTGPPCLDQRPATAEQVRSWTRNRRSSSVV